MFVCLRVCLVVCVLRCVCMPIVLFACLTGCPVDVLCVHLCMCACCVCVRVVVLRLSWFGLVWCAGLCMSVWFVIHSSVQLFLCVVVLWLCMSVCICV